MTDGLIRCPWGETADEQMRRYHDDEWGKPCRDEQRMFELLILEGAQAGLSWATVLHKRAHYRVAFDGWDIAKIAAYDDAKVAALLADPGIIRNRLKISAAITNARATLALGSLSDFIWSYVGGRPIVNQWERQEEMPATSPLSDAVSRDMKARGFKFVGSTIIYSYLQATGVIDDHIVGCAFKHHGREE
jgi:DNA-3-methyladenine glycosylase I